MAKKVLCVVDLLNDFIKPEGALYIGHEYPVKEAVEFVHNFYGEKMYIRDSHDHDSPEFEQFPIHCIRNTWGAELIDELMLSGRMIPKQSFSDPEVTASLMDRMFVDIDTEFHFIGVCTHICVHDVISNFVNDARTNFNTTPRIIVHKRLVGDFDPEQAEYALRRMQTLYGAEVI